ncbi:MAG: anthranilate phosphoribosyltransferase [Planctomycetota bacterium]
MNELKPVIENCDSAAPAYIVAPQLETLLARQNLSTESAIELAQAIIAGRVAQASLGAVLIALRAKGESVEEIAAFAQVMRASAIKVQAPPGTLDTCGTGGDKSGTFNISTATALVVAGMGIPVAKHGGRAVSSSVGSADALKALGVNIEVKPDCVERCIKEAGIGFMFAPAHHPGMKQVAPVRKELGIRTIFNLLGPLSNPAGAKRQLIGVCDRTWCEKFAVVLKLMGSESALVVCGAGPGGIGCLDEVSTFGPTTIARLKDGVITMEELRPESLGLATPMPDALRARSADDSAAIIRGVLSGTQGAARDIVLLNAAAAALAAGKTTSWQDGLSLAARSVDEGRARIALEKLIALTYS